MLWNLVLKYRKIYVQSLTLISDLIPILIAATAFGLPFPGLNAILPHGQRSIDPMQLVIQSTGVANGLPFVVSPPKRRGRRSAVRAAKA